MSKLNALATTINCEWNGLSMDDMEEPAIVAALDISFVIEIISQLLPLIRDCRNRETRMTRLNRTRRGKRFLLRRIEQTYHNCCDHDGRECNHEDCREFAKTTLDSWMALSSADREEIITSDGMLTTTPITLEAKTY